MQMKVHYTSSLWSKEKGACGVVQKINYQFEHLKLKRYIPCIYHFKDGIVFDLLTFLDADEMKTYYEKYEGIEERLSPIERQCAEQEHPLQRMEISEIWIDGIKIEVGFSFSESTYIPFLKGNSELLPVQEAYRSMLDGTFCFNCRRFCVPYPGTNSTLQKLLRTLRLSRINTLQLITHEQRRFYPINLCFTLSDKDMEKNISFVHPVTKDIHNLYLKSGETIEISQAMDGKQHLYSMEASYEINPPLQQNDRLQFGSSISYTSGQADNFNSCSSMGFIGGACGPTAIFMAGKGENSVPCGPHGLPLHHCFSAISSQKSETAQFVIQGLNTKAGDSAVYKFQK
jgi:hypothetical protein